jgi:hypothetical protein
MLLDAISCMNHSPMYWNNIYRFFNVTFNESYNYKSRRVLLLTAVVFNECLGLNWKKLEWQVELAWASQT